MDEVTSPKTSRISWLDGWRTVAVTIVIVSHIAERIYAFDAVAALGKVGVFIFFAISGFIVTKTLLSEKHRHGDIDYSHFYIRRALRIIPPLAMYVAFCTIWFWPSPSVANAAMRSLAFTCNLSISFGDCGWVFGHTWSLAFEEQFYILLPFAFLTRWSWLNICLFIASLALAAAALLWPIHFIGKIGFIQIYMLLILGALFACFEKKWTVYFSKVPILAAVAALMFAGIWSSLYPSIFQIATGILVAPCIVLGVFTLPIRSVAVRHFLGSSPMRTVGLYSYTLYLWQQFAFVDAQRNGLGITILLLSSALAIAAISYHTLEKACRRLAANMMKRRNFLESV